MTGRETPGDAPLAAHVWPDIPDGPLILVPAGSTEQHGPHLPLDTDSIIATAVATAAAAALNGDPSRDDGGAVLVAPTLNYGASGEHQGFPGTVSIGHDALSLVLIELVRSLSTWAGRIVVVNGHGGNVPTVAATVSRMRGEGHDVAWVPCVIADGDAHAGRTETSLLLHLAPTSVDLARARPGNSEPIAGLLPRLAADGVRAVSESGVLGDPTGASAEEGAAILAAMADEVCRRIRALGDRSPNTESPDSEWTNSESPNTESPNSEWTVG